MDVPEQEDNVSLSVKLNYETLLSTETAYPITFKFVFYEKNVLGKREKPH